MWRKRLRLGIAIFGLIVAAVVLYALRPREARTAATPIEGLDPQATVETRGGEAIQLSGSRQNLRIEFEGQATYPDGQTRLTGVKLMVDNRAGRNFIVTGDEARVGAGNATYDMSGNVRLEASDGLTATAGSATYVQEEGIVRVPGPVQFQRGQMSGAGIGFTYDEQRNTVWLLDQAVVRFKGTGDEGPMDVASGAAGFARTDRYMRFERGVRMNRGGQIIEATEATVFLFPDRDEPDRIELRGNASVTGGTGLGALRAMRARDINLDYADDGRTLQQATLAGQSAIQMANQDGSDGQRLAGEFTDIVLAEDGAITSLTSRENVTVVLPAAGDAPPRTIRSAELRGTGQPGQGLTGMHFKGGVVFSESAAKGRPARTARASALTTRLAGGTGALEEARFDGGFRFEEGALRVASAEAIYRLGAGTLAITGREGTTMPNLSNESLRIDAESIDLTLSPRRMAASGTVKSTLQPTKGGEAEGGGRRPGLLGDTEPVIIVSDEMTYDEVARRGDYTGQARLLQGDTQIFADSITLDETNGNLGAKGNVRTTLALAQATSDAPGSPPSAADPTIVVASTFSYADETRRAVYDAAPPDGQARMVGEQGDLRADHIELALADGENALDELRANGQVTAIIGVRTAKGAELTYRPADARYVMVGAPVTYEDECNSSAGKTLTFYRTSDRVTIDGNQEVRTETRGGKCPGTPPNQPKGSAR